MKRGLALVVLALLAACTTTDSYMEAWVGRPIGDAVAAWGAPARQFKMADGIENYTWSTYYTNGGFSNECRRSFTVDEANLITAYSYSGCPEIGFNF